MVHDSWNLLLYTQAELSDLLPNKSDNSDVNDDISERYSDIDFY